jgi:Na+-translocating ferredoxin:NAD+ oxidoreductase RnfG subunit
MGDIGAVVALIIGIVIVLFTPALVWATVIAGLYQIVREKVREGQAAQTRQIQEAHEPVRLE